MAPWPWKRDTVKKCAICGKHIDETEQIKIYGDGVHIKKTYYCSNDCWNRRGLKVGSKLGIGCKFYHLERMCCPLDFDHKDASEQVPCSLRKGTYKSCNVYPILETRRNIYETKMHDQINVHGCCVEFRMASLTHPDELRILSNIERELAAIKDINARNLDPQGYTLLHCAAKEALTRFVKVLLDRGANVNAKTHAIKSVSSCSGIIYEGHEYSVLEEALGNSARNGDLEFENRRREVVKLLLNHGAEVNPRSDRNTTPLYLAVKCRDPEIVKQLIAHGVEVNPNSDIIEHTLWEYTPLMSAIQQGEIEIAQLLIEAGADLNTQNYEGSTPLNLAVSHGQKGIVKLLVDYGVDVNTKDQHGRTPIELAETDEIKKLLKGPS